MAKVPLRNVTELAADLKVETNHNKQIFDEDIISCKKLLNIREKKIHRLMKTINIMEQEKKISNKITQKKLFKLLKSLATEWMTLGTLFGIDYWELKKIKEDNKNEKSEHLLLGMLNFAYNMNPQPTVEDVLSAVDEISPRKAAEIAQKLGLRP